VIIVTGGSSGLGKSVTEKLRATGNRVISLSRKEKREDTEHISCDISDFHSLKLVYNRIKDMDQPVSAIINCAGIASMNLALTTPPDVTERIIKINLIGTIYSNQIFAPLLIKNKGGRIINFSTIAVHLGLKGESVYVASKAGVEGFSRVLAHELSAFNITVNCIAPGPIKTNLLKGISDHQINELIKHQIINRAMNPLDVASIVMLLLSDEASSVTGQVIHVGGV
jgi:3-oxoacyl-[acyl-carrier protein] reductase